MKRLTKKTADGYRPIEVLHNSNCINECVQKLGILEDFMDLLIDAYCPDVINFIDDIECGSRTKRTDCEKCWEHTLAELGGKA